MTKFRSKTRNLAEYAVARSLVAILARLPWPAGMALCRIFGDLWHLLDRRRRERSVVNCQECLSVDEKEARRIVTENYRHYTLLAIELAKLERMSLDKAQENIECGNIREKILAGLSEGKGMIFLTGHLGNWEWASIVREAHHPHTKGFIAQPLKNPYLDKMICRLRERGGGEVWQKSGAIRKALRALRDNRMVVAVVDQSGRSNDPRIPFLGKEASVMATPVDMALRTGAPLIVAALIRSGKPGCFVAKSGELIRPNLHADSTEERLRLLTQINQELGDIIRSHPEQWLWIYNRWKRKTYAKS